MSSLQRCCRKGDGYDMRIRLALVLPVLAAFLAGCTSPAPTSSRDTNAAGSSGEPPAAWDLVSPKAARMLKPTVPAGAIRSATERPAAVLQI